MVSVAIKRLLPPSARRVARRVLRRGRWSLAEHETRYNLNQVQGYEAVLNRHGLSLRQFSRILDFACGPGRLTQYLFSLAPQAEVYGCDPDEDVVIECRRKCPKGRFYVSDPMPPLAYEDEQFDLIWSYSIFTSLPESLHKLWLRELTRTLRPGGVMLHTTHSYEYLRRTLTFSPHRLEKYEFPDSAGAFMKSGSGYYYIADNPLTPDYGQAIISREYVSTNWPLDTGLTVKDYAEGAIQAYPEGCQDIVMLVK